MATNSKTKLSIPHILFLLSGIVFIVYYLLSQGMPSLGNDITSIMKFVAELFILILLIGFYFYFFFEGKGCAGTIRAIAPALLVFIVVGEYSMNFGNAAANAVISGLAAMFFTLILVCGFVFLFIPNKLVGLVFTYSSVIYAAFVTLSYTIVAIMTAVNGGSFSLAKLFETLVYVLGLGLFFTGGYLVTKHKDWTLTR